QIPYAYPDRSVFLDVFTVTEYSGKVRPIEGQKMDWVRVSALGDVRFPKANHGIVRALQLPGLIAVTPEAGETREFLQHFEDTVRKPEVELVHLRSHGLDGRDYLQLAGQCLERCDRHRARLVINANASFLDQVPGAGLHLTSRRLCALQVRPVAEDSLVSASCHTLEELLHASEIGLDYVFLGPVIEKVSDTPCKPLGWKNFARLARHSTIPVYAIGGLDTKDMEVAAAHGGQGIAAIRAVWQ
ncbi:MAG: thiamine phosphate synthase, partial [Gammaproteobacteria bacterium]|nr:thiamine phosphate synthase [Gammaproteobacteria bacterium]